MELGYHLGRSNHPSSEVSLEAELIVVALVKFFALVLVHDVCRVGEGREECGVGGGEETLCYGCPWRAGCSNIGDNRSTVDERAHVVRPLAAVDLGAIGQIIGTVVDMKAGINKTNGGHPVPFFHCPVGVGAVASVSSKTGCQLEKPAVGDRALVVIAGVGGDPLPLQTSPTLCGVPSRSKIVEHPFGKFNPWGRRVGWVGKLFFGG